MLQLSEERTRTAPLPSCLPDVQEQGDDRGIPIEKVGIRNLEMPVRLLDPEEAPQDTVARVAVYVSLPAGARGTHMSRFVESLQRKPLEVGPGVLDPLVEDLQLRLKAERVYLDVQCPFFLSRKAPVSGLASLMNYEVRFRAEREGGGSRTTLQVRVPVQTLCPCSKAISSDGAHNQRSRVAVQVRCLEPVGIGSLVEMVESSASTPLYALLKRSDEKHVTEKAYRSPAFAEDLVRNVAGRLRDDPRIGWYRVEAENQESIHNHDVYALVSSP